MFLPFSSRYAVYQAEHVGIPEDLAAAIDNVLKNRENAQPGKNITVYIGSSKNIDDIVKELSKSNELRPQNIAENLQLTDEISARFDAEKAKLIDDKFIQNKSLLEIGKEHGITPQRICQKLNEVKEKIMVILST